ncbi:sugar ABC transporter permease [Streptomyces californicus]
MTTATAGGAGAAPPADETSPRRPSPEPEKPGRGVTGTRRVVAAVFLLPALVLLGALVVYPIGYSVYRSFFDQAGTGFAGFDNYTALFTDDTILTAVKNNAIWVVFAPTVATALGLIFAVLTERIRWGTAFKLIVFMPMAISMLAAGIIFRLVYDQAPERGVANAVAVGVHDTFNASAGFPKARPLPVHPLKKGEGGAYLSKEPIRAGQPLLVPLVGVAPAKMPGDARPAQGSPAASGDGISGTAWLDFTRGGGGKPNVVDPKELGLKGLKVEAVRDGKVVASATAGADGVFTLPASADRAQLRLPADNFREPYNGVDWLGPSLVTPGIIGTYVWMSAGFAMVLIAGGTGRSAARTAGDGPGGTAPTSGRCSAGSRCRCSRRCWR